MKRKDVICVLLGVLLALSFLCCNAFAENDYGASDIENAIPENAAEKLDELGITSNNESITSNLTIKSIFDMLVNAICEQATSPLRMLALFVAVILLSALLESFKGSEKSSVSEVFDIVSILSGAGILTIFFCEIMAAVTAGTSALSTFLLTFVPSFGGILTVNGLSGTAAVYNALIITATQVFSYISTAFIMPASTSLLGISLAGTVNPDLHIENIASFAKKAICWILGLIMTVFSGLLSIQSFITSSADSVALRAARFTFSSGIPIVGGAVADALSTVQGGMQLIKSNIGVFGIITIVVIILPPLISVLSYKLVLSVAEAVCSVFGVTKLNSLVKCAQSILSVFMAILVFFSLCAVVSTALMLAINTTV